MGEDSNDSTLSARELRAIPEEYGIDVSRVTVSESLREMHLKGIFQEAVIPDEDYLFFSFFEYQFLTESMVTNVLKFDTNPSISKTMLE